MGRFTVLFCCIVGAAALPQCQWSSILNNTFVRGCAAAAPPSSSCACACYASAPAAEAACAANPLCTGITSQDGGLPNWELRSAVAPNASRTGEASYVIENLSACRAQAPSLQLFFGFDSVFGDNMVLQQAPAKAAVYGFLDYNASMGGAKVLITLTPEVGQPITVQAAINATYQTFGPDWGVRPCASCPDINPPFNPFNQPLASWKALLPPQAAGGNYTITAACTGCSPLAPSSATIANVAFGDMWYCMGQSVS